MPLVSHTKLPTRLLSRWSVVAGIVRRDTTHTTETNMTATINRLAINGTPSTNGKAKPAKPAPTKATPKPGTKDAIKAELDEAREALAATQARPDGSKQWAYGGVALMAALSMGLNGMSFGSHAPAAAAGWMLGIAIPGIILILARVAGLKWKAGKAQIAKVGAAVIVSLLALSVWHCAESIAALSGSPVWMALPMAIAIDCGLVYCEAATLDA